MQFYFLYKKPWLILKRSTKSNYFINILNYFLIAHSVFYLRFTYYNNIIRNYYGRPRFISLTWYCVWIFIIFIIQPKVKFKFCVNPLDANDIPITLMTWLTVKNKNTSGVVFYTMFHYVKINALCNLLRSEISKVEFLRNGSIIYKIQILRKIKILEYFWVDEWRPEIKTNFHASKTDIIMKHDVSFRCIIFKILWSLCEINDEKHNLIFIINEPIKSNLF